MQLTKKDLITKLIDAARKAALCILLGAAVGMASVLHTANRLERIRVQYAGRPLVLTAEVESTADSYDPDIVDAVLHVEKVNGSAASFRVECSALPECKAGERVQGRFILSDPASGSRVGLYADGIALRRKWTRTGRSLQFWAKAAASAPAPTACSKGSVRRCAAVWTARPAVCWLP